MGPRVNSINSAHGLKKVITFRFPDYKERGRLVWLYGYTYWPTNRGSFASGWERAKCMIDAYIFKDRGNNPSCHPTEFEFLRHESFISKGVFSSFALLFSGFGSATGARINKWEHRSPHFATDRPLF